MIFIFPLRKLSVVMRWGKATALTLKAIPRAGRIMVIILLLRPCTPRAAKSPKTGSFCQREGDRASGAIFQSLQLAVCRICARGRGEPGTTILLLLLPPLALLPKPSELISRLGEGRKQQAGQQVGMGLVACTAPLAKLPLTNWAQLGGSAPCHSTAIPPKVKLIAQGQGKTSEELPVATSLHPTVAGEAQP